MKLKLSFAIALLLLVGCSNQSGWDPDLAQEMYAEIERCVEDQGFKYPTELGGYEPADLVSDRPEVVAYDECWGTTASLEKYEQLGFVSPTVQLVKDRKEGFASWKCIEENGYIRIAPIPLNVDHGYPVLPDAVAFDVDDDGSAIRDFYEVAAECADIDIEHFQNPFGELEKGDISCLPEHTHQQTGETHEHNCASVDEYPTET